VYDALTIAAIVDELNDVLVGGRIQQVVQPDASTVALEVYALRQRRWLVASAHPEHARLLLSQQRIDGDAERVSPLLLLLRKYARGGRIVAVSQPRYERIVQVSIAKPLEADNRAAAAGDGPDELELTYVELFVELMGRRSNLILSSSEGRILDAIKRVSPEMSRVRPIRPGARYVPPPPQDKADPQIATPASLLAAAHGASGPLERWLVGQFLAISPIVARELVFRIGLPDDTAVEALDQSGAAALVAAMKEVFAPLTTADWQPGLYVTASGRADFSGIQLHSLAAQPGTRVTPFDSVMAAAEAAWQAQQSLAAAGREGRALRHAARRERLLAEIDEAHARLAQRVRSLREQEERAAAAEQWRLMGEAIYAAFADIQPGQAELRTAEGLIVPLDPALSASQNAQEYFERYRKARSAEEHVPALVAEVEQELQYLEQLRALARLAESYDEIEAARLEWLAWTERTPGAPRAARPQGARPAASARRPRALYTAAGDAIFVGRTGPQNETVTFDIAQPGDLWLHARNMPGAHVILRASAQVSEAALEQAAALAAWYSAGRGSTSVPVDVTERRHVRKIRGAGPGLVTYRNERTLRVRPQSAEDLGLRTDR
jgi:predicted ribosome quality control (RQC) complex YloA/Tae2 family protein